MGIKLKIFMAPKVKGFKNSKNKPQKVTKANSWPPKQFLVCYSIRRVPRWFIELQVGSYNILNCLKWIKTKKVMRFERMRGPKTKNKKNTFIPLYSLTLNL
jgi:hypothetical protein